MNFATMRRALGGPPAPCAPNHSARLAAIVLLVPTALVAPELSRACATWLYAERRRCDWLLGAAGAALEFRI